MLRLTASYVRERPAGDRAAGWVRLQFTSHEACFESGPAASAADLQEAVHSRWASVHSVEVVSMNPDSDMSHLPGFGSVPVASAAEVPEAAASSRPALPGEEELPPEESDSELDGLRRFDSGPAAFVAQVPEAAASCP